MLGAILLCGVALRRGLVLRRARRFRAPLPRSARAAHLRAAKVAVAAALLGFVGGPVSAVWLRHWEPFASFHGWVGLLAAALLAAAAGTGHRIEVHRARHFDAHALLGMLGLLAAVVGAVAGFVLLP
jgi:hypothetical protein